MIGPIELIITLSIVVILVIVVVAIVVAVRRPRRLRHRPLAGADHIREPVLPARDAGGLSRSSPTSHGGSGWPGAGCDAPGGCWRPWSLGLGFCGQPKPLFGLAPAAMRLVVAGALGAAQGPGPGELNASA